MSQKFILKLSEVIKTNRLSTRETARKILNFLPPEMNEYIIDFSEIEFISRSFAHEMIKIKRQLELQNKKIEFQNTQEVVKKMLEIVSQQNNIVSKIPPSVGITKITTLDQL